MLFSVVVGRGAPDWARRSCARRSIESFRSRVHLAGSLAWIVALGAFLPWVPAVSASPVTATDVDTAAKAWLGRNPQPLDNPISQQVKDVKSYAGPGGAATYYVVSLDPAGFVVLPADDLVMPIIAFSATGFYDPAEQNTLVAMLKADVTARVSTARQWQKDAAAGQQLPLPAAEASARWTRLLEAGTTTEMGLPSVPDVRVPSFIQSRWNQSTECGNLCYNYYTPNNYYSGCVATAMAQVMRFHQYPTTGVGTSSFLIQVCGSFQFKSLRGGNGAGGPYDWANMTLDPNCNTTDVQRQAIGALCHDAGVSMGMDYCSDGSATDTLSIANSIKSTFGYANAVRSAQSSSVLAGISGMVNPNLDAGYPAVLGITDGSSGHAIVADGYGYSEGVLYHHLNMGWSGSSDAWYNLPNIDSSYPFDTVYKCVYNIYVTGSGEIISGRVTFDDGTPIEGAVVTATRTGGGTYTATTNVRGIYAFSKVPSNSNYQIEVAYPQYSFTGLSVTTGKSSNGGLTAGNLWGVNFQGSWINPCPAMYGDADYDDDVDQEDFGVLQRCLAASETGGWTLECQCFDRDGNKLVTSADVAAFKNCTTGAGSPSDPASMLPGCERQ